MRVIWNETPGSRWTNTTGKAAYQFVADLVRTCGVCLQYHHAISGIWPLPLHYSCRCRQVLIPPAEQGLPFVDFRAILDGFTDEQKREAVGASNYALLQAGKVEWSEVVTQSRVRTLAEVVARNKLSVQTMVRSGVQERWARQAFEAVNTPEHQAINAHRAQLVANLRGAGLTAGQIQQAFGERIAQRVHLEGGPTWHGSTVGGPVTTLQTLAPALFLGLGLNQRARAALQQAEPAKPEPQAATLEQWVEHELRVRHGLNLPVEITADDQNVGAGFRDLARGFVFSRKFMEYVDRFDPAEAARRVEYQRETFGPQAADRVKELQAQAKSARGKERARIQRELEQAETHHAELMHSRRTFVWQSQETPEARRAAVVAHEVGHAIDSQLSIQDKPDFAAALRSVGSVSTEDMLKVSIYGASHPAEMVAEIHALHYLGRGSEVPKPLADAYRIWIGNLARESSK